jgi:hypothetical protein
MTIAVALTAFLDPAAAEGQVTLGARLGYAVAGGDAVKDGPMSDVVKGAIPIQLDLGYAVTPDLTVGAYVAYGFGRLNSDIGDACDALSIDCSARVLRLGIQGAYSFTKVSPTLVPWVGLGVGYENAKLEVSAGGESATQTMTGWEFLNLQGGLDFKATPQLLVGPFLSFSFNQFGHVEFDPDPDGASGDIDQKGTHTYLTFGVRGQFGL